MITYQNRGSQLKETMGKSKAVIISAMFFIGALPFVSQAYAEAGPDVVAPDQAATPSPNAALDQSATPSPNAAPDQSATPSPNAPHALGSHDVQSFFIDSREFKIGDIVPDIYRTKPYEIVDWSARHLPPPEVGSHWTYMGGNYVLITDGEGKMLKAESGDIFSPMWPLISLLCSTDNHCASASTVVKPFSDHLTENGFFNLNPFENAQRLSTLSAQEKLSAMRGNVITVPN